MAYGENLKYFMITCGDKNPFPQIVGWNTALDVRKLNRREYQQLPSRIILDMQLGLDACLPDMIASPFLLLSRGAMETVALYAPDTPFLFAALFDTKQGKCGSYYCPILEDEDCVLSDGSGGGTIVLARERMKGLPLFRIKIRETDKTMIRMDLAESLLEREAVGLELQEVGLA